MRSSYSGCQARGPAWAIEAKFDVDLPLLAFYNVATIRSQATLVEELGQG